MHESTFGTQETVRPVTRGSAYRGAAEDCACGAVLPPMLLARADGDRVIVGCGGSRKQADYAMPSPERLPQAFFPARAVSASHRLEGQTSRQSSQQQLLENKELVFAYLRARTNSGVLNCAGRSLGHPRRCDGHHKFAVLRGSGGSFAVASSQETEAGVDELSCRKTALNDAQHRSRSSR